MKHEGDLTMVGTQVYLKYQKFVLLRVSLIS